MFNTNSSKYDVVARKSKYMENGMMLVPEAHIEISDSVGKQTKAIIAKLFDEGKIQIQINRLKVKL